MSTNLEPILESAKIVAEELLKGVSFDKTEICTIIQKDADNPKRFLVSNGSLKFWAYTDDTDDKKYTTNLKVYVRITNGDYNLEKVITGVYNADKPPEEMYTNPFDKMAVCNTVTFPKQADQHYLLSIVSNSNAKPDPITTEVLFNYKKETPFNYLGVELSFNTIELISQHKGLFAVNINLLDSEDRLLKEVSILSSDLYGNPYALTPDFKFQLLFLFDSDLDITTVKRAQLQLINKGGFKEDERAAITLESAQLYFGYKAENISADKTSIFLGDNENLSDEDDPLKYLSTDPPAKLKRKLYLEWEHIDSFGMPFVYNETYLPNLENYYVYWLHFTNEATYTINENKIPKKYGWKWELLNEKSDESPYTEKEFSLDIDLVTSYSEDRYMAIVKYKTNSDSEEYEYILSQPFVFESFDKTTPITQYSGLEEDLKLYMLNNDPNVFNIYGLDGCTTQKTGPYTVGFEFFDKTPIDESNISTIEWEFPIEVIEENGQTRFNPINSMITKYEPISNYPGNGIAFESVVTKTFYISSIYNPGAMNNRIWCNVGMKDGTIKRGSLTLQFGEISTSGSNYSLNIDFIDNATCLYAKNELSTAKVLATFLKNGKPVPNFDPQSINWTINHSDIVKFYSYNEETQMYEEVLKKENETELSVIGTEVIIGYNGPSVPNCNYAILQATIPQVALDVNGITSDLNAYLSIPIAKYMDKIDDEALESVQYKYISGPTRVVYAMDGKTASYSKDSYKLFTLAHNGSAIEESGLQWICSSAISNDPLLPTLSYSQRRDEYTLLPANYFIGDYPAICITAIKSSTQEVLWSQPILILSNSWQSSYINNWDGSVRVNNADGNITAPFFMAGRKAGNNRFSGVVIGDLEVAQVINGTTTSSVNTGIYGFNDGNKRYALTDNGEFYVGDGTSYLDFSSDGRFKACLNDFELHAGNNFVINSNAESGEQIINFADKFTLDTEGKMNLSGWEVTSTEFLNGEAIKSSKSGMGVNDFLFIGAGKFQHPNHQLGDDMSLDNFSFISATELQAWYEEQYNIKFSNLDKFIQDSGLRITTIEDKKYYYFQFANNTTSDYYRFYDGPTSGSTNIKPTGGILTNRLAVGRTRPSSSETSDHFELDINFPNLVYNPDTCSLVINRGKTKGSDGYYHWDPDTVVMKVDRNGATIAGWNLTASKLYGGKNGEGVTCISIPRYKKNNDDTEDYSNTIVFAAGTNGTHNDYSRCQFRVTQNGHLFATAATIGGNSTIAGWNVSDDAFSSYSSTNGVKMYLSNGATAATYFIRAGKYNPSGATEEDRWGTTYFGVDRNGKIIAQGGTIAGWSITPTVISKNDTSLNGATGKITTSDIEINGGSISIKKVFKVDSQGNFSLSNTKGGYFLMGPSTSAGELVHPYASALNLAYGEGFGLSFRSSSLPSSQGSQLGSIIMTNFATDGSTHRLEIQSTHSIDLKCSTLRIYGKNSDQLTNAFHTGLTCKHSIATGDGLREFRFIKGILVSVSESDR